MVAASPSRRSRERAGERQLAGFVDDENVHGVLVLLARPEPGGAAENVDGTGADRSERFGIVLELDDLARAEIVLADLVAALHRQVLLLGRLDGLVEQQPYDLVALGSD